MVLVDEGFLASLADRILHGEVIYRDFYTLAGPLPFYLVAMLFSIFGKQLIILRWMFVLTAVAQSALVLLIVRRLAPWPLAAAAAVVATIWNWLLTAPSAHNWMPQLFATAALYLFMVWINRQRAWLMVASGILCGLAAISKTTTGSLAAAALCVSVMVFDWISTPERGFIGRLRNPALLIGGFVVIFVPVYLLLLFTAGPGALSRNLLMEPTEVYAVEAAVAYPSLYPATRTHAGYGPALWKAATGDLPHMAAFDLAVHVMAWGSVFFYVLAAAVVLKFYRTRASNPTRFATFLSLLIFACASHLQVFPRADVAHLAVAVIPAFALAAVLAGLFCHWLWFRFLAFAAPARYGVVAVALLLSLWPFWGIARVGATRTGFMYALCDTELKTERAHNIYWDRKHATEMDALVAEIQTRTSVSDRIFVAPSAAGIYFLADRRNATPYELCFRGAIGRANLNDFYYTVENAPARLVIYGTDEIIDGNDFRNYATRVYDLIYAKKPVRVFPNYELFDWRAPNRGT